MEESRACLFLGIVLITLVVEILLWQIVSTIRRSKMEKELKTSDWKIYNFIKSRSEKGLWTSRTQVREYLSLEGFNVDDRTIRKHINNIRNNDTIQKVLLISSSKNKGYKFYTSQEDYSYLYKERVKILENNGQMKITFKPYERDYIQSVLKEK